METTIRIKQDGTFSLEHNGEVRAFDTVSGMMVYMREQGLKESCVIEEEC